MPEMKQQALQEKNIAIHECVNLFRKQNGNVNSQSPFSHNLFKYLTFATLQNFTMTSARCWGVVLLNTIHCIHCERPLKRAIERSNFGLSFNDAVIA